MPRPKLTEAEKFARKADRENARRLAAARAEGLFAEAAVAETRLVTGDELYWKWRRQKAGGGLGGAAAGRFSPADPAARGLLWVQLQAIERFAAAAFGAALGGRAAAHVRGTYPMPDYGRHVWKDLLTGRAVSPTAYRVVHDRPKTAYNPDGRRVVPADPFPPSPVAAWMTAGEFDRLFPPLDPRYGEGEADDPGGLFEVVMAALRPREG